MAVGGVEWASLSDTGRLKRASAIARAVREEQEELRQQGRGGLRGVLPPTHAVDPALRYLADTDVREVYDDLSLGREPRCSPEVYQKLVEVAGAARPQILLHPAPPIPSRSAGPAAVPAREPAAPSAASGTPLTGAQESGKSGSARLAAAEPSEEVTPRVDERAMSPAAPVTPVRMQQQIPAAAEGGGMEEPTAQDVLDAQWMLYLRGEITTQPPIRLTRKAYEGATGWDGWRRQEGAPARSVGSGKPADGSLPKPPPLSPPRAVGRKAAPPASVTSYSSLRQQQGGAIEAFARRHALALVVVGFLLLVGGWLVRPMYPDGFLFLGAGSIAILVGIPGMALDVIGKAAVGGKGATR